MASTKKLVQRLIIAVGMIATYAALYSFSHPGFLEGDADSRARRRAEIALTNCLYVFQEIGVVLEENQMPDPSLRCADSSTANIITRSGNSIRVSHPNPQFHGVSEIFVTNTSHEPVVVE